MQEVIDIAHGVTDDQARKMAAFLKFEGTKQDVAAQQIKRLYSLFLKVDATQIEINPFGETPDGQGMVTLTSSLFHCIFVG
jgi:succinyl-CoA synthetase beta subunit